MELLTKPIHQHDCDVCQYLGSYDGFDLYICITKSVADCTLLARFGSEGGEYASTAIFRGKLLGSVGHPLNGEHSTHGHALRVAYLVAKDMGLLTTVADTEKECSYFEKLERANEEIRDQDKEIEKLEADLAAEKGVVLQFLAAEKGFRERIKELEARLSEYSLV